MFEMPYLTPYTQERRAIYQFTGYDSRDRIADGASREMQNLSHDAFPCITPRQPRKLIQTFDAPTALFWKGQKMIVVDGTKFLVDGEQKGTVTAGKKQMVAMHTKVLVWPDKVYYDTASDAFEQMDITQTAAVATFTNSTLTLDTEVKFQKGDGVKITGCKEEQNNRFVVIEEVDGKKITVLRDTFQHGEPGSEQPENWTESNIKLERTAPELEFVCQKDNRLWGVYDNAIACSKLGDPLNWMVFAQLSTDSWEATVGTDGAWTGIAAYGSHIVAFKEHTIHKVYGQKPTNFQVQTVNLDGVQSGCEKSIINLNETLFYLSRSGLMAYAGGIPDMIGEPLGTGLTDAACGYMGDRLYLSAKKDGKPNLFVYDTSLGVWMREDDTLVTEFAPYLGQLYWLSGKEVWSATGGDALVEWSVQLGRFEEVYGEKKIISRLFVLADMEPGADMLVEMQTDGGEWKTVSHQRESGHRRIPIIPVRCMYFAVRLSGHGKVVIRSVVRRMREGSDL